MTKWREIILLSVLILFGFGLRIYKLDTDLLFHRDQGLHSISIWNIWHEHRLSLLGPLSDVDGLIHAPIYYWMMTPAYAISGGDPVVASYFQIFLEMVSLPFLFFALKKWFDSRTAWLTIILYTISYGYISLSRWLVNVTPIMPLIHVLLYLLATIPPSKHSNIRVFICSLLVGIATQIDAAVGIFIFPLLLWIYLLPLRFFRLFYLFIGFLLPATPLFVFELRHQFVITKALFGFSTLSDQGLGVSTSVVINNIQTLVNEITKIVAYKNSSLTIALFILGLVFVYRLSQRKLIYFYLLIPLLSLSLFQRGAIGFFLVPLLPLSLAIVTYAIRRLPLALGLLIFGYLVFVNISLLQRVYRPTNALTPIGSANLITIQDRKNILDWIYQKSDDESFSVWFYTLPYFQEEVWQYQLLWYAQPKYGYLPEKTSGFSPGDLKTSRYFFAVWEPDRDNPSRFNSWKNEVTLNFGEPLASYQTHDLYVEKFKLE